MNVNFFPFIALSILCHCFLACQVSTEKLADGLRGVPMYITCHFSLTAFSIHSLHLIFIILITVCFGVVLFGLILFQTLCAFWSWLSLPFPRLWKFSAIMFSNMFSAPLCLCSTPIMQMAVYLILF